MVVEQGEIWWADLPTPIGSGPGYRRPVLIVQSDRFNHSKLKSVVVVPLTGNLRLADAPGNTRLSRRSTGLDRDSVANVTQITSIDEALFQDYIGRLSRARLATVLDGLDLVLGRERP